MGSEKKRKAVRGRGTGEDEGAGGVKVTRCRVVGGRSLYPEKREEGVLKLIERLRTIVSHGIGGKSQTAGRRSEGELDVSSTARTHMPSIEICEPSGRSCRRRKPAWSYSNLVCSGLSVERSDMSGGEDDGRGRSRGQAELELTTCPPSGTAGWLRRQGQVSLRPSFAWRYLTLRLALNQDADYMIRTFASTSPASPVSFSPSEGT